MGADDGDWGVILPRKKVSSGVRDVQVARVAEAPERKAAHHLGLQDPLPRRALSP